MDKVDLYLKNLLRLGMVRHPYGEALFQRYDLPYTHGMDIRMQYQKHDAEGRFFLIGWMLCTCDIPRHLSKYHGNAERGTTKYVQSYLCFKEKGKRDTAYLILDDQGLGFNNFGNRLNFCKGHP